LVFTEVGRFAFEVVELTVSGKEVEFTVVGGVGSPDPSPAFDGMVGTLEDFDFEKIWSRCVAAAATPTPATIALIALVDTAGIISSESNKV